MNDLVRIIKIPKISDQRGSLSFFQSIDNIPFNIIRTSILSDKLILRKKGFILKNQDEFTVVLSGSVDIQVISKNTDEIHTLNEPNKGLYIPKMIWRNIISIAPNSIILIVGSGLNKEKIYKEECNEFLKILSNEK